jgi:hypothetical protein
MGPRETGPGLAQPVQGSFNSSETSNRTRVGDTIKGASSTDEKDFKAVGPYQDFKAVGLPSIRPSKPLAGAAMAAEPRGSLNGEPRAASSVPWELATSSGRSVGRFAGDGAAVVTTVEGGATQSTVDDEGPTRSKIDRRRD